MVLHHIDDLLLQHMNLKTESFTRRQVRSSYASVIISISLVLLLLGILGLLLLNAGEVAKKVRESFAVQIILDEDTPESERITMQKELALAPFAKEVDFVSKDDAAKTLIAELDENFIEFLGYNPLQDAFDLRLKAEFVKPSQLLLISRDLSALQYVDQVLYDENLLERMNENIKRIGIFLLLGSFLLLLISIALINSSIRLSIYSKRFIIKTMQLVGATSSFIRKPFMMRSIWHGILGAILASSLLFGLLYFILERFPDLKELMNPLHLAITFIFILLTGTFISWICTFFAVRRYLSLKTAQLYY